MITESNSSTNRKGGGYVNNTTRTSKTNRKQILQILEAIYIKLKKHNN